MNREQYGPTDGKDVVLILGWGNKFRHETVQWLIDTLTEDGYRIHGFELPITITDFYEEYLEPVENYVEELSSYRLLAHSTGGLIGAYLSEPETATYLCPWWGFQEAEFPGGDVLLSMLSTLPTSRRIVPKERYGRAELGELASDRQVADNPDWIAPRFIREVREAHRHRPPIDDDATVFCTLTERLVSLQAIGAAVDPDQIVLFDGGHEYFSSTSRERHLDQLLAAVDAGASAL